MTTDDRFAVLSALLDREPVDPDALAAALEHPEARAQLVDFVRLRALTARELAITEAQGHGASAFTTAAAGSPRRTERPARLVRSPFSGRLLRRAATILLPLALAVGGGLFYTRFQEGPSEPDRGVEFRAPQPDRVVEFTPGVDWNVEGGGR